MKAEKYDLILAEFDKCGITKVTDRAPQPIVEMFAQIPDEMKYRHPIGYITYADFYLSCVDMEGGARLLAQIEQYYQSDDITSPALKRRISGEIELSKSLLYFNDLRKMHELQLKAHKLLGGSSSIANKDMIFTFGSPHTLYTVADPAITLPKAGGSHGRKRWCRLAVLRRHISWTGDWSREGITCTASLPGMPQVTAPRKAKSASLPEETPWKALH